MDFVRRNVLGFRRKFTEFGDHNIVVTTESNSRYDGDNVSDLLDDENGLLGNKYKIDRALIGSVTFLTDSERHVSIFKCPTRTRNYILSMSCALKDGSIRIHEKIGTANTRKEMTPDMMVRRWSEETLRFKWPDADPDNRRYSGRGRKTTGKNKGENDDLAIAALMVRYFSFHYSTSCDDQVEYLKRSLSKQRTGYSNGI